MDNIKNSLNGLKTIVNIFFDQKEPWQISAFTASSVLLSVWLWNFLFQDENLSERLKKQAFRLARLIPSVRDQIDSELKKINSEFENEVSKRTLGLTYQSTLPPKGLGHDEIFELAKQYVDLGDFNWKGGHVSGAVYYYDENLIDLVAKVYGLTSYTNPLHPDVFPGICKMEAEVVRITANLFHGTESACGTMTSGGTESILMACKAYRDYGRATRGIKKPEIIMPATAHTAFDKAAQYLGLKVKNIPIDPRTTKVDVKKMEKAISGNTIMLICSAPNFPYGTMDDVEAVSNLGVKYNVPVHVDACLGGFVIAFMKRAGFNLPPFDFSLRGVTSISADTHKYGFAPKGSSVILYSDKKYRHHQFTVTTDWPGGVYGSPTVGGSRAGGVIATCWATLMYFGLDGYVKATEEIINTTIYVENELRKMDGIFIFGKPTTSVIAIGSKVFEIYRLSAALNRLGWNLNVLQFPSGIHICITHVHTKAGVADQFLDDVRRNLKELLKEPTAPVEGKMAIYGVAQSIPDRSVVGDFTRLFLDSMYYIPGLQVNGNSNVINKK